jgi:signal transduction histidine kinase
MILPFSIRTRLALSSVGLFGISLIVFCSILYQSFLLDAQNEFDGSLNNFALDVVKSIEYDRNGEAFIGPSLLEENGKLFPFVTGRTMILFRTRDGAIIARSRNSFGIDIPFLGQDTDRLAGSPGIFQNYTAGPKNYRLFTTRVTSSPEGYLVIQVAAPTDRIERDRQMLLRFFYFSVPLLLLIGAIAAYWLAGRSLRPLFAIIKKTESIRVSDLSTRVPVPSIADEIQLLATSVNDLLSRLETAFESQERFVADASHQLKTPLTILKGEISLLIKNQNLDAEAKSTLSSIQDEVSQLSRMVENLLLLARVEAGVESFKFSTVRLEEIVMNEISRHEKWAAIKKIRIRPTFDEHSDSFEVIGHEDLLSVLVQNLIENAIKYSPENSQIEIRLIRGPLTTTLEVLDQGSGVADAEKSLIFNRLYRSTKTDAKIPGSGLGLALSRQIADLHRAKLSVGNRLDSDSGSAFLFEIKNN